MRFIIVLTFLITARCTAQRIFLEDFDIAVPPSLPAGWQTTANRLPGGDFTTTASVPRSDSNAVLSTNATIAQALVSPSIEFVGKEADSLLFYERRSGTHNSGVLVEISLDGGATFPLRVGDTLRNPGNTAYVARRLKLPASLNDQRGVRFRWRVVGNGTGSTGTLRFDDIAVTARAWFDIGIRRIIFLPRFPAAGDSTYVRATVENDGRDEIRNFDVEFYVDRNGDSLPDPGERFSAPVVQRDLFPGDTVEVDALLRDLTYGVMIVMAKTSLAEDQNPGNDLVVEKLQVGLPKNSLIINEIMYAPKAGEPEWLELFNSFRETVDLRSWRISNRNTESRYTISAATAPLVRGGYIVITKDTALFRSAHSYFSGKMVQSVAMPTFLFNNSGDAAVIIDPRGAVTDSTRYSPSWGGGHDGRSLERIEPEGSSTDSSNWAPSGDSSGSTPGRQNYRTPLELDLQAVRIMPDPADPQQVDLTVRNTGRRPVSGFSANFYADANEDSLPGPGELIDGKVIKDTLLPRDTLVVQFSPGNLSGGRKLIIGTVEFSGDMRPSDNEAFGLLNSGFPPRTLVINEIMYDPLPGRSEYIELFNLSDFPVDIRDWKMADGRDTAAGATSHTLSRQRHTIGPHEYLVVASDSSLFVEYPYLSQNPTHVIIRRSGLSLNNEGDDIFLLDLTGRAIDSLHYLPSWHNAEVDDPRGRSLERINPYIESNGAGNWSTSAAPAGGTPGRQNSLFELVVPLRGSLSAAPNPFSPDWDGTDDACIIQYNLASSAAFVRARIFDATGRLIRTLIEGGPSGSHGEIIWDGFTDERRRVRMGIYILVFEARTAAGTELETMKSVIVVASRL